MGDHRRERAAVFVDQSGRRGKILTAAAIGAGILVLALTLTVVSGALAGPELPPLGWPGNTRGNDAVERSPSPSATPAGVRASRNTPRRAGPAPSTAAPTPRTRTHDLPAGRRSARPSPRASVRPSTAAGQDPEPSAAGRPTSRPASPRTPTTPSADPETASTPVPTISLSRAPDPGPDGEQTPPERPGQPPEIAR